METDLLMQDPVEMESATIVPEGLVAVAGEPSFEQPQVQNPERFTGHRIQLQIFEGPLDLLLYLIRAHRYDVCDIPIQEVTKQFLDFLQLMDEIDLEYAGDFLVTAATLMQIKSRMLLPKQESANEEEMDAEEADPRQQLIERLLEYQRLQEAAETLQQMRDDRGQLFTRPPLPNGALPLGDVEEEESQADKLLLQDISTFDLLRALQKVLDRMNVRPVALVRREPFSLPDRIRTVIRRLVAIKQEMAFSALCDDCESRLEVVLTFLALLELIRRGRVHVKQHTLFDEIWVASVAGETG
jgi:segregation and condensation protein A